MRVPRLLAAATIQARGVHFVQELQIVRLLFEGGVYSKKCGTCNGTEFLQF